MQNYIKFAVICRVMAELKVTSLIKSYTLLLLKRRPMHGYELIKELEDCTEGNISASHVYPFLKVLQKKRLVAVSATGKRERKEYKLTASGQRFAQRLIDRFAELIESSISARVRACAHCGCKLVGGWHTKRIKGVNMTFCCVRCADSYMKW
jgi:DNA-binding PadR family transcriptional regulator